MDSEEQRFFIKGSVYGVNDVRLQHALARIHDSPERPRCMCVPGGVEMYIAKHKQFVVKRMPDTGSKHAVGCPSYESDSSQSGLGELMHEAIIEHSPEFIELRVDFALTRTIGRSVTPGERGDAGEVAVPKRRMSLRALMHYLFDRAQLNRWTAAMEGKRNQGVLHKYLMEAAEAIKMKGMPLAERLYVPEPFAETTKQQVAERRRRKFASLGSPAGGAPVNMALVLGEFKGSEETAAGRKIWVKHMPDVPLLVDTKTWTRIEKVFGRIFEARDADMASKPRVMLCALIYAKREHIYQIDTASFMLTTAQFIPVNGIEEIDLVQSLVEQKRRFIKPLQYDAKSAAAFPNAQLLDAGDAPVPLHVTSGFMSDKERSVKEKCIKAVEGAPWVWNTDGTMPPFPVTARRSVLRHPCDDPDIPFALE